MRQLKLSWDEESFDLWADVFGAVRGERLLLVGIIQRAVLDYLRWMRGPKESVKLRSDGEVDLRFVETEGHDAFEFLFSPGVEAWSFRWILSWLSDEPDDLREAFHKALRERVKSGGHVLKHVAHCRGAVGRYRPKA